MDKPGSHQQVLDAFRAGLVQVLLGTQMIAKGHDFPGVTLVGVVQADSALHFADFRAAERTFQLLAQVAGRAGRGTGQDRVLAVTAVVAHQLVFTLMESECQITKPAHGSLTACGANHKRRVPAAIEEHNGLFAGREGVFDGLY